MVGAWTRTWRNCKRFVSTTFSACHERSRSLGVRECPPRLGVVSTSGAKFPPIGLSPRFSLRGSNSNGVECARASGVDGL
eukprot:8444074-Pyramimonas_sp.AAC.1